MRPLNPTDREVIRQIDRLSQECARHAGHVLYDSESPWVGLGEKHKILLQNHGFDSFKRTANFEYHQWGATSLRDSKIRRLAARLALMGRPPFGPLLTRMDSASIQDIPSIRAIPYAVFMGLLWQYALATDDLGCLRACREPKVGSPLPVTYGGRLVSQDLATSSVEANFIARYLEFPTIKTVAEVGAGYGRLAQVLLTVFPHLHYSIFDIPPAVALAQMYLRRVLPKSTVKPYEARFRAADFRERRPAPCLNIFLPHQLEHVPDGSFDLVINISSFDEMTLRQVEAYLALIDRKCRGWFYIKGHERGRLWSRDSTRGLSELPYPSTWRLVTHEKDPYSPTFVQRIYRIGLGEPGAGSARPRRPLRASLHGG